MGADLYIKKLDDEILKKYPYQWKAKEFDRVTYEAREKLREENNSYFRDSYNNSNVMWTIGFSYWGTPESLGWSFTKDRKLSVKGAKQFLQYLKDNQAKFDKIMENLEVYLKEKDCTVDEGENSIEVWRKYYTEKYARLVKFVQKAVDLKSQIEWSV